MTLIILIFLVTSIVIFFISNRNRFLPSGNEDRNKIIWRDRSISSPSEIQWQDHPTEVNLHCRELPNNEDFLNLNKDLSIEEKLKFIIGSTDYYSQEIFMSEDEAYFCSFCNLAYHEDSWQEINKKCASCNSDQNTRLYKLPRNT